MKNNFNKSDDELIALSNFFNFFALIICWISVVLALIYFSATAKIGLTIVFLQVTPFRYLFFDIAPSKLSKRPPSLDRTIPLTIYVSHLTQSFSMPHGKFLASCWGFFLALGRAFFNGYGLLYFDSFTFLYKVKNDKSGLPINQDIKALYNSERIEAIKEELEDKSIKDPELRKYAQELTEMYEHVAVKQQLTQWNFELKRYVKTPTVYFKNAEIGNAVIDDKYALDIDAYNRDHPDHPILLSAKARKLIKQQEQFKDKNKKH